MFTFYFREDHGLGRSWVWDWEPGCGPPKKGKKPGSDLVLADYVRFWLDGSSLETSHCAILNRQACFCLKLLSWSRLDANQIWHVYWVDDHRSAGKDCACLCFCDRCSLHGGILESKIWVIFLFDDCAIEEWESAVILQSPTILLLLLFFVFLFFVFLVMLCFVPAVNKLSTTSTKLGGGGGGGNEGNNCTKLILSTVQIKQASITSSCF